MQKVIKATLLPPHTVNVVELHQLPPFFSGLSTLSCKNFVLSQVTQILEGPTPLVIRGGGPTMVITLTCKWSKC